MWSLVYRWIYCAQSSSKKFPEGGRIVGPALCSRVQPEQKDSGHGMPQSGGRAASLLQEGVVVVCMGGWLGISEQQDHSC